jgi:raffinose/stachyose/melibiose transport system permease protein
MSTDFRSQRVWQIVGRIILSFVMILYLVPVGWMYTSSMRTNGEILLDPLGMPSRITFENHVEAWQTADLGRHFLISIAITTIAVAGVVAFSTLAGYGFSRLDFPFRRGLYVFFLFGLILPVQSFLVGMFILFRLTGLLNTLWSVILPTAGLALPLAILLAKTYFDTLPSSLEESAYLEGASSFAIFRLIILPLSTPIVATILTFSVIAVWNEFMIPFVMIQTSSMRPLTTSLYVFSTRFSANYALILAALTMIATPMFLVYVAFQSQIQRGITAGAIKN